MIDYRWPMRKLNTLVHLSWSLELTVIDQNFTWKSSQTKKIVYE